MTNIDDKWDARFLELAKLVSSWSKDPSTQVGAVITKNKQIISIGYNGLPSSINDSDEKLVNRDIKYKTIIHGEINALLFANTSIVGCTLYTYPFMPCSNCASIFIQAGISRVVTLKNDNPRWFDSFQLTRQLFNEASIELTEY